MNIAIISPLVFFGAILLFKYLQKAERIRILICIVLTMLMSCATSLNDVLDGATDSFEASNKAFLDLNEKLYADIKSYGTKNPVLAIAADSLFAANQDVDKTINRFKKEIKILKLVGMADKYVQLFFSTPSSRVLSIMVEEVDTRAAQLMDKSIKKPKLERVSRWARSFHKDSLWSKKHVVGEDYHRALLAVSKIQRSCSMATNLALAEILDSLRKEQKP